MGSYSRLNYLVSKGDIEEKVGFAYVASFPAYFKMILLPPENFVNHIVYNDSTIKFTRVICKKVNA